MKLNSCENKAYRTAKLEHLINETSYSYKLNSNGEIEVANLIPGKYYIQEVSTKDGYELNNEVFEFNVNLNEEFTITIDNSFKEEPEPKTTKQEISHTVENVKKLPVTGM